jgi:hypothetical protein
MIALLILPFLFGDFVQKWYIPQGVSGFGNTIMQIVDMDRDTHLEFIFTTYGSWPPYIYVYELHLPDAWQLDSIPLVGGDLLWDSGDFDDDGLYDLALQFHIENPSLADGIMIYESPDSFSYPTQEVWRDTVGQSAVVPISVYDVDQDMLPEIIDNNGNGQPHWIWVYESTGNNQYDTVCTFNPMVDTFEYGINSTYAFGDFDDDGRVEFVGGDLDGYYWVFESPSNNTYEQTHQGQLPTHNIKDCVFVPDADGDGKLEFVVKGFVVPTARINAFIFEATGDNTYEIIKSFDLFGGHNSYYGGYSDVGDVDGDSIPEIALEGCQNIYILKVAGNDSFYVWETLPGNNSGSSVRVFDIDGNGLSEVIISGNNETRIYEYEVGVAESTPSKMQIIGLSITPNPFRDRTIVRFSIHEADHKMQNPTLKIYDACGRLIRYFNLESSIVDCVSAISWQGDDDAGRKLSGGVYFLTLAAGDYSATKKLLLIR